MNLLNLVLIGVTSTAAYLLANRIRQLNFTTLLQALAALLDWIGLFAVFFMANLTLGLVSILMIRGLTPRFVSLYELQNLLLLIFSAAQAFVFHHWWKRA